MAAFDEEPPILYYIKNEIGGKNVMNADTAGIIAGGLSLRDVLRCRLVCTEWRGSYKIPPLEVEYGAAGSFAAARRHDVTLMRHDLDFIVIADEYERVVYVYEMVLPNEPVIKGFPLLEIDFTVNGSMSTVSVLKSLFGRLIFGLPIYVKTLARCVASVNYAPPGTPLDKCRLSTGSLTFAVECPGCAGHMTTIECGDGMYA